jgi:cobalamin biosynthesis Mg chelatase CobN
MIQKKSFIKYTIILQIFLLLFAMATIPVSAAPEVIPSFPLSVGGEVTIDGEVAPVGTEITVKLGEKTVGTTTVESEGVYGDLPTNRLLATSEPDDYENLKFYVNGVETDLVDLTNAAPGAAVTTTLASSAPAVSEKPTDSSPSSSSSSSARSSSSSFDDSEVQDASDEENTSESIALAGDGAEIETTNENVPSSEAESSALVTGIFGLILVSLVGAIIIVKRKK